MAIVPLVTGLLFTGIAQAMEAARTGPIARQSMTMCLMTLVASAVDRTATSNQDQK